ncbi:hypothetical protein UlMin_021377 [Ulmus minor]
MNIKCDVCEKEEAAVLCCADEAVLCVGCDEKVHAANKLSRKHERLSLLKQRPLLSSSHSPPLCDVCRDKNGYVFCLEDRELLCKRCDASKHTASRHMSSHQRYFIADIKVSHKSSTHNWPSTLPTMSNSSINTTPMTLDVSENYTAALSSSDDPQFSAEY